MSLELVDTHCHLDMEPFGADQGECITRALAAGVSRMLTVGTGGGLTGARQAIAIAEKYPMIWASVGIHPLSASDEYDPSTLEELARHPRVVAIGETGLDFFREGVSVDVQHAAFETQIKLARKVRKPLIIHSRQAATECLDKLIQLDAGEVGGVFHCFSENAAFAAKLRDINFMVSFPGILTFKKSDATRSICAEIPIEQIMLETDAPFLAPEPFRGKRCEPSFVAHTARQLASIKGLSLEEVGAITTQNALKLFSLMR